MPRGACDAAVGAAGARCPVGALQPRSLRFLHLLLTSQGAPVLPRPVPALPQPFPPGGRLTSHLHTARENKPDCQAASSRQNPGPGLSFFFRGLLWPPCSVPAGLTAALAEEEQGALPSACARRCFSGGSGRAARSLRETKGRRQAGKRREALGSPAGAPPRLAPPRPGPPRPGRGAPSPARGGGQCALGSGGERGWRGAELAGIPLRESGGSGRVRRTAAGGLGVEGGIASPAFPCRDGRGRAGTGPWRGGHGSCRRAVPQALPPPAAAAVAPGAEAPWVASFLGSVKHTPFQRPGAPGPPGREVRTRRLSPHDLRVTRGKLAERRPCRGSSSPGRSSGLRWRSGAAPGRASSAAERRGSCQGNRLPESFLVFSAAVRSGGLSPERGRPRLPRSCGGAAGGAAAGLGFQVGGRGPEPPQGAETPCSHAFLRGFLAFLGRGHS